MIARRTILRSGFAAAAAFAAPRAFGDQAARWPREVLAFYYPWYGTPTRSGRWLHWQGPAGEASRQSPALDHPVRGAYDSHDPAVIAAHAREARDAGITALVVSWWGRDTFEDAAFPALLEACHAQGLKVSPYLEQQKAGRSGANGDLAYLAATYGDHPAFLRTDGRPVLFLYLQALRDLPARDWRAAADATGRRPFLVGDVSPREAVDFAAWAPHMDGIHVYVLAPYIASMDPAAMAAWADRTYPAWKRLIGDRLFCATVIPGFDDRLVPGRRLPRPTVGRFDGRTYAVLWDAAIRHRADWVIVTSFNEWHEGSEIEPSREYGTRYLELTAQAARRFRAL